jgi:hypothetical protein
MNVVTLSDSEGSEEPEAMALPAQAARLRLPF